MQLNILTWEVVVTIMNYINLRLNSLDKTVILQYGSNFTLLEKDSKRIQNTTTRDLRAESTVVPQWLL